MSWATVKVSSIGCSGSSCGVGGAGVFSTAKSCNRWKQNNVRCHIDSEPLAFSQTVKTAFRASCSLRYLDYHITVFNEHECGLYIRSMGTPTGETTLVLSLLPLFYKQILSFRRRPHFRKVLLPKEANIVTKVFTFC